MTVLLCLGSILYGNPSEIENDLLTFRSIGSREDGSTEEKKAFTFISERLDNLSLDYSDIPLDSGESGHSFSSNLVVSIPGTLPGRIALIAPVDGGGFAMALLLNLAEELMVNPPRHEIVIVFAGAERGSSEYHPYGGQKAVRDFNDANDTLALYIDSEEIPQSWIVKVGGDGKVAPRWYISELTEILSTLYIPFNLRGADIQLARLGMQGETGVLAPWIDSEIPTLHMKGTGIASGEDRYRQITRLKDAIYNLDARIGIIPANTESSFVFLRPLPVMIPRIVPELPFVAAFLVVSAILLIVILTRYRAVSLNLRRFTPYWWAWPLLITLVFIFNFLATLFIEEVLLLADFPELWMQSPGTFIFFKLSVATSLALIFILITRGLPLPRSPHFYSYAAVITSGLSTLIFMAMDINLAAYSIWTNVTLLLMTVSKSERRKVFYLIMSLIPYLSGLYVLISEPYLVVIKLLLTSRISANILITLAMMPVIFMVISLSYWQQHYRGTRRNVMTPSATLILSISSIVTLIWILNMEPYGSGTPQPVRLIDSIDLRNGVRRLEVTSPAPIGNAELSLDGVFYRLEDLGRKAEVKTPLDRIPLSIRHSSRSFLGRKIISLNIEGESDPGTLELKLRSETPFTIHDCDFPFEMDPGGMTAEIFIGNNPPVPLELRFTVNDDATLYLSALSTWDSPEDPPGMSRSDLTTETYRITHLETAL